MTALVIADIDTLSDVEEIEPADVLISCGDVPDSLILVVAQKAACCLAVAVRGNHDSAAPFPKPIIDLHLRTHTYNDFVFGGFNGAWKYKPRGHYLYEQSEVIDSLASFPTVSMFVAHNSPRHVHDCEDDVHYGFVAFTDYIYRVQPKYFIHGHQHLNTETQIGGTRVIGVYGQRIITL